MWRPRPRLRTRAAGGRCGSRRGRSGAGRAAAAAPRGAGRRAAPPAPRPSRSASSPGRTTALTVRKARSPLRQIETSGSTSEAGASEDQVGVAPPSGSKAKPPSQTGPAPAGSPRGSSSTASLPDPQALLGDVAEAASPARGRLVRDPQPRQRELAVGLLPAEPAIGSQPRGEDGRAGIVDLDLPGDAYEGAAPALGALAQRAEESLSRDHDLWRSRRCGPFRPGRAGGPSARRPRSCRPSR